MFAKCLIVLTVLLCSSAMGQTYRTTSLDEVKTWFLAHSRNVTVLGSTPIFSGFTDLLVAGVQQKRIKVQIITGDAGINQYRRVAQAGGAVRLRSGAFGAQNGYSGVVVLLEGRYILSQKGDTWYLIESFEGVTQVQSRFDLLWEYCKPIPLR
jgi:hypothetical protein